MRLLKNEPAFLREVRFGSSVFELLGWPVAQYHFGRLQVILLYRHLLMDRTLSRSLSKSDYSWATIKTWGGTTITLAHPSGGVVVW